MKKTLLIILMLYVVTGFAQKITNVRSAQDGNNINIYYDLITNKTSQLFNVSVYCSMNGGKTYGNALTGVSGDVGKNINPGLSKKIVWNVFQDVSELKGEIVFNVKAEVDAVNKDSTKKKDPYRKRIFIASSTSNAAQGGFMAGRTGKIGYYLSLRHSINPRGFSASKLECDTISVINYDKPDGYYKFTSDVAKIRFSLCGGVMHQFTKHIHGFSGLGFGFSSLFWKINEYKFTDPAVSIGSRWAKYKPWDVSGLEWEVGIMYNYKWVLAHVGFTTLKFQRSNITAGIGIAF